MLLNLEMRVVVETTLEEFTQAPQHGLTIQVFKQSRSLLLAAVVMVVGTEDDK
mgnify:CR=1 FL=1